MEKISVAIRVKPPSKGSSPVPFVKGHKWNIGPHNVSLYSTLGTPVNGQNYSFDHVFGTDANNGDIYGGLAKGVIMSSLDGFNGTVFAYGQTSSGKTYTMKGTPSDPGIIRLAVHDVFSHIRQMTSNREFLIRVSYMEIYNEEINDLFAPENRRLRIHENLEKGIFVAGLREEIVDSPEQVFDLLEFGENHRHFGETNMNLYSSRSHTIFRMVIESRDAGQDGCEAEVSHDAVRVSCLNMVDLAGSERIVKTGAGGVRLKEGTHINKSLLTLGTVINKLSDGTGKQGGHIPYRDSKLTRILQPALGGNAKTAMICTITPDEIHIDETRGTLQFASRAKRVSTCAQVNEIVTDAALLKRQTKEIEDLRMKLQGMPQSAQLEKEILTLRNELLKFELEKERLYLELQEEKKSQVARERRIKEQEQKIENLSTLFRSSNLDDRDMDKINKKVNRRETWCPRPYNSDVAVKDLTKSLDETEDDETIDNILYSMRRERNHTLPPAFEIDEETDPFWPCSNGIEEPEPPSDFGNIADEDTWMSLNRGHTTSSALFPPGFGERAGLSTDSAAAQKVLLLESQLTDLQARYADLESSCDVKIEEATREINEELSKIKRNLGKVQIENLNLKNELLAQLEMHRELQYVLEGLELEMNAAKAQTGSMQGILTESLHVQSEVLVSVQDQMTVSSTMGKYTSSLNLRPDVTEKRLSVANSVEQCRKICEEAQNILQGRLSSIHGFMPNISTGTREMSTYLSTARDTIETPGVRRIIESGDVNEAPETKSSLSLPGRGNYCVGCMSSMLSTSGTSSTEGTEEEMDPHEEIPGKTADGQMIPPEKGDGDHGSEADSCQVHPLDLVNDPDSYVPNGLKAHALRALALHTDTQGELGACQDRRCGEYVDLTAVLSGFPSCRHVGCSFGTFGTNCDTCENQERAISGKDEIPREMGKLCSIILGILDPFLDGRGSATLKHSEEKEGQTNVKLKTRLSSAKLLAIWLWEEVEAIARHDVECLSCHVREGGHVGIILESLQVLLLRIANLAIGLLQATCQDADLKKDLRLQLNKLKGFTNNRQCAVKEAEQVDSSSGTVQQEITGVLSVVGDSCEVDNLEKESFADTEATLAPVDQRTEIPLEMSSKQVSLCNQIQDPTTDEYASLIERLKMSNEHIATLDRQYAISRIEKDRLMQVLIDELNGRDESLTTSKLEQRRLAKNLQKIMGKMAVHNDVVSTICVGIKDFERELGQTPPRALQQPTFEDRDNVAVQINEGIGEDPSDFIIDRVLKVEGVDEVLGGVLQNSMVRLNKEHQVVKGEQLSPILTSSGRASGDEAKKEVVDTNVLQNECTATTVNSLGAPSGGNFLHSKRSQPLVPGSTQENNSYSSQEESSTFRAKEVNSSPSEVLEARIMSTEQTGEDSSGPKEDTLAGSLCTRRLGGSELQVNTFRHPSAREKCKPVEFSFRQENSVVPSTHGNAVKEKVYHDHQSFIAQLLSKTDRIRELEIKLADAELEIVELKIELEALRAEMQAYGDMSQNDLVQQMQSEIQAYKEKCENCEEEMRLLVEQFPSSAENLQRERQLTEVLGENQFLQDCLAKAKKHVLRSKAWRDELRKWKEIENTRRDTSVELQSVSVRDSTTNFMAFRAENKGGFVRHSFSGAVHVEFPHASKNEGNVKEDGRRFRPALRVLDLNARNGGYSDTQKNPKGRRQLQFPGDENSYKSNLSTQISQPEAK